MKDGEFWLYVLFALLLFGLVFGFAWLVGTSNLPDWVKFALLR